MNAMIDGNTQALRDYERLVDAANSAAQAAGPRIEARADELRGELTRSPALRPAALESITECDANAALVLEAAQDVMKAMLAGQLDSTDRSFQSTRRAEALAPLLAIFERCTERACLRFAEEDELGEMLSDVDIDVPAADPAQVY